MLFFRPAIFVLAAALAAEATQIMRRPSGYKSPARIPRPSNATETLSKRATGKVNMAYYTNWGIYGRNFQPQDIVPAPLTHVLYSFADTNSETGAIFLTDPYADTDKHYPTDSWSEAGNNVYGCLKQLYLLKLKQRNLKVMLSIGGWTYSQSGHFNFVVNPSARAAFVSTAIQLIEDLGFDGIDIDYEYPSNSAQGQGFADLVTSLRAALDALASRKGDSVPYEISAAVAAGPNNYLYLPVAQLDKALTHWNLMAYDFAGSWLTYADHQANLYGGPRTGVSTDAAVAWYLKSGATASKIVVGIPLYGRAFENTAGIGSSFSGIGPGTIEAGVYSYQYLPLAGATVVEDTKNVTSYSYNSATKELVSYDTPRIATIKAQYVANKGLAGAMFWELSTDRVGSGSLVSTTAGVFGGLDQTPNHIRFPNSKYDNIKNNMAGGTTPPAEPGNPGSGSCAGVAAWTSAGVFVGGTKAVYGGHLWIAKWWTQNETPGGTAGVWTDNGACTA